MKTSELLEAKASDATDLMIGKLMLKLQAEKKPMKVLITGLKRALKKKPGERVRQWQDIPDQEWDITGVRINKTPLGNYVRVSNKSPEQWFELNPEDDEQLRLRNKGDYWLLTSADGKGVKI